MTGEALYLLYTIIFSLSLKSTENNAKWSQPPLPPLLAILDYTCSDLPCEIYGAKAPSLSFTAERSLGGQMRILSIPRLCLFYRCQCFIPSPWCFFFHYRYTQSAFYTLVPVLYPVRSPQSMFYTDRIENRWATSNSHANPKLLLVTLRGIDTIKKSCWYMNSAVKKIFADIVFSSSWSST